MENKALPLAEMKKIVEDCFAPNPWIYWADMLITAVVAYGSFLLTEWAPALSFQELFFFALSVCGFYRGVLFVHELTHQERRDLPGFSVTWNIFFGIPMLLPSFLYRGVHIDHHRKATYGTDEDGEYLPFGASPFSRSVLYLGQSVLLPFLLVFRFGVLAPLSLLHPKLRHFIMAHTSSLAIRTDTARKVPKNGVELRNWYALEALGFGYVLTLFLFFNAGLLSLGTLRHMYLLVVAVALLNSARTLVAHRYRNRSEKEITFTEQFLDSVNIEGNPVLMEILAPVGLRYHALHHVFANMPYHNLGTAHRRLKKQLPKDSLYHLATEPTFFSALQTHWKNTREAQQEEAKMARNSTRA
jgi:fatty acid desaturase